MSCVSLQRKPHKFQEESFDLETQLLELGFLCEDWNVADPDALLEPETFTTVTAYDALNRATSIRTPHNAGIPASEILPAYNEASLLESVNVKLRGAATATNFVSDIDYDAKGQRERIQYGNGSTTGYTYDEKTFRLKRLLTTRNNGADILQDLNYTYDAAGNIAQIDDAAQQTIFFNGSVVSPSQKFEYDALYRLVKATGREHVSVNADGEPEAEGYNAAQISPQDGSAMRNYSREWEYDSVGNILSMIHKFNGSQWTRRNAYATDSNRLNSTAVGQTAASFAYNAHGSMASMPHLSAMDWDFAEKLRHITRGTTEAYYNYDGNGIRTRKVVVKNGVTETRLYLGGFEIWRKTVNGTLETERETLHVMDDQKRIAIVETLTVENGNRIASPAPVLRYQLDNHLGSASLELDASANIISYEEYYPYGDTSYRAGRNASEVSRKRYRYTGKEKDEESSLYYCEQRYYAAHISRWVSTDPTWLEDGINLYAYVHGNPLSGVDPSGMGTENNDDVVKPVLDENNKGEKASISKIKKEIEIEDKESLKNRFINEPLEIDSYDDLPTGIPLSQKEKGALIQEYIDVLSAAGDDTQWLEEMKSTDFQIISTSLPKKINSNGRKSERAMTIGNDILFNSGPMGKNDESVQINSPKGKALLLHELRHVWQSNNPEWKEKYAAKDIDIEVDAFEIQYRFEKLTGVENEGRKMFDNLDEFARNHGYDFKETRKLKARDLWEHHGYGNPKMKYTNHYIQEKK